MRIVHCAPFNTFTKTGGALYSNPIKLSLGFSQNGHFVHNFDYRDTARYFSVFKNKKNGSKKMNQYLLQVIDDLAPDIVLFGHAEMIEYSTYEYIKNKKIKMVFWYNDLPLPADMQDKAHYFDLILSTAAGMMMDDLHAFHEKSFFMPNLVDKSIEKYRSFENQTFQSDILFTGRYDDERAQLIDFIKDNIQTTLPKRFIGLDKSSVVIGDAYLQAIANTKIALSHNRKFSTQYKWFTSDRLMHILGNGTMCFSTPMLNNEDFFEDKLEIYHDLDELKAKTQIYLDDDAKRITNSTWLHKRTHELFNSKRVSQYIVDLLDEDHKQLKQYEWFND
ncbi:MAG: hypothetical protein U9N30_09275 [Campylobacterota bacterium]|nr:hypothetical protein [Campylobacterota bacterium]